MKAFAAGAALLVAAMFTFQPAVASTDAVSTEVDAVITAPVAVLAVDSPVVTTEPAPIEEAVPVVTAPVTEIVTPVTVPTPVPVTSPVEASPVPVEPSPVTTEAVPVIEPTAVPVCEEDQPCWDCSTMGNRICGRDEAFALSGYTDWATFMNRFGATQKATGAHRDGYRYVPSIINPEYVYAFNMTTAEMEAEASAVPSAVPLK